MPGREAREMERWGGGGNGRTRAREEENGGDGVTKVLHFHDRTSSAVFGFMLHLWASPQIRKPKSFVQTQCNWRGIKWKILPDIHVYLTLFSHRPASPVCNQHNPGPLRATLHHTSAIRADGCSNTPLV